MLSAVYIAHVSCQTGGMAAIVTARERARAELTFEIKEAARRQLAESGAAALSVRAVARELEMASSAVYRYFASRDELLTALIVDAYQALGHALTAADSRVAHDDYRLRWSAACRAMRRWAKRNPHAYALIYGSPVPGYRAPRDTIGPAAEAIAGFFTIVGDAVATGALVPPTHRDPLTPKLEAQLASFSSELTTDIPTAVLAATFQAFSQLIGMVSLELFGHFVGSVDPTEAFFDYAVAALADLVGLPER